jgi:hypothetical protein
VPVLISTVTAMPGDRLTRLSSICVCAWSKEIWATYKSSWSFTVAARALQSVGGGLFGRRLPGNRVLRQVQNMEQAIAREIERTDFDFGLLIDKDKTNAAIGNHGFDF